MSGVSFSLEGLEETIQNLDYSIRKVNDGSNEVLRDSGEILRNVISINTPVLTGEAQANVVKSNVITDGSFGGKSIKVGYSSAVAWRMWFLEEGTYSKGNPKGIAPRKMVSKSLEQSSGEVIQAMTSGIGALIASI